MKKVGFVLLLFLFLIISAVCFSLFKKDEIVWVGEQWTLSDSRIKNIEVYGSQQPIKLILKRSTDNQTRIQMEGEISKSEFSVLKDEQKTASDSVYLPLSKHGFHLTLSDKGKSELKLTITLSKNSSVEKIYLDTLIGNVETVVPKDFDGVYKIHQNHTTRILSLPDSGETERRIIEIDAYGDVNVHKEDD